MTTMKLDLPALSSARPDRAPAYFHVMAKPSGAICNLDCKYCFFLSKEALYPGSRFRMGEDVLEAYIHQLIESQQAPQVTIAWQGGEPTMMGLDFFRQAMALVEKHRRPGISIDHTIQTNGTLLDDEWCRFFAEHNFLVGLSLDGPREMHDANRVDKRGDPTFDQVWEASRRLRHHKVNFNILCTVHAANGDHPLEVYRFFRDEVGAEYLQFIPIIERATPDLLPIARSSKRPLYTTQGSLVTDRSIQPEQWGAFLIAIFDEWVRRGEVRFACNGGCPRNRFIETPDGEQGMNYLCAGYRAFFNHVDRPMRLMADLVRNGRYADGVMAILVQERAAAQVYVGVGRNEPCPCGSGTFLPHYERDSDEKVLTEIVPFPEEITELYIDKTKTMMTGMFRGSFVIAFVQGLVMGIVLWIAGVPSVIFFTLLSMVAALLPVVGLSIVAWPIGIILLLNGQTWQGIWVIAAYLLVVSNIDFVLRPRLVPEGAYLNPALLLIGVFGGINLFGPVGLLYGPVIMVLLVTSISVYTKYILRSDLQPYLDANGKLDLEKLGLEPEDEDAAATERSDGWFEKKANRAVGYLLQRSDSPDDSGPHCEAPATGR